MSVPQLAHQSMQIFLIVSGFLWVLPCCHSAWAGTDVPGKKTISTHNHTKHIAHTGDTSIPDHEDEDEEWEDSSTHYSGHVRYRNNMEPVMYCPHDAAIKILLLMRNSSRIEDYVSNDRLINMMPDLVNQTGSPEWIISTMEQDYQRAATLMRQAHKGYLGKPTHRPLY